MKILQKHILPPPPRKMNWKAFLGQIDDYRRLWKGKNVLYFGLLCVALILTQCKTTDPPPPPLPLPIPVVTLVIEDTNVAVSFLAGTEDVKVTSTGIVWSEPKKVDLSWVTNFEKVGDDILRISYAANATGVARDTTLAVTAGQKSETITFKQTNTARKDVILSTSMLNAAGTDSNDAEGKVHLEIEVTAPVGWTIKGKEGTTPGDDGSWLAATKVAREEKTYINIVLDNNTRAPRTATLTISIVEGSTGSSNRSTQDEPTDIEITITQSNTESPYIILGEQMLTYSATGETKMVSVSAPMGWEATSAEAWIIPTPATDGTALTIQVNPNNMATERTGTVTLSVDVAHNTERASVFVTQAAAETLSFAEPTYTEGAGALATLMLNISGSGLNAATMLSIGAAGSSGGTDPNIVVSSLDGAMEGTDYNLPTSPIQVAANETSVSFNIRTKPSGEGKSITLTLTHFPAGLVAGSSNQSTTLSISIPTALAFADQTLYTYTNDPTVGIVEATGGMGNRIYTLQSPPGSGDTYFALNTAGVITKKAGAPTLTVGDYTLNVQVTDAASSSATATITIKVYEPLQMAAQTFNVSTDIVASTAIGPVVSTQGRRTEVRYTITGGGVGSTLDGRTIFEILDPTTGNITKKNTAPTTLTAGTYTLTVEANDNIGRVTATITLSVSMPVALVFTDETLHIYTDATSVGTLAATGGTGNKIYALQDPPGSGDAYFALSAAGVITKKAGAMLTAGEYVLSVQVTDVLSSSATATITIKIYEPLAFTGGNFRVPLGSTGGTTVGTLQATNGRQDNLSYALQGTSNEFSVATDGTISVQAGITLDTEQTYSLMIAAEDGIGSPIVASVSIEVTNAPILNPQIFYVYTNATAIGTLTEATGGTGTITYQLLTTGTDHASFSFDANTRAITAASPPLSAQTYTITIQVSDANSLTDQADITIHVYESLSLSIDLTEAHIYTNIGASITIATLTTTGGSPSIIYTVTVAGSPSTHFQVNASGQLIKHSRLSAALDATEGTPHMLSITATDDNVSTGTDTESISIHVYGPLQFTDQTFTVSSNIATSTAIGPVVSTQGRRSAIGYTITGGGIGSTLDGSTIFEIASTGNITKQGAAPTMLTDGTYTLTVMANDNIGSATATITLKVITPLPAGLIPINNLEQLDAMRYDLNGDGVVDNLTHEAIYKAQFPTVLPTATRTYTGYTLMRDLDFKDAASYAASSTNPDWLEGDGSGEGWEPIPSFAATFDGKTDTLFNLYINRPAKDDIGLFGITGTVSTISNLGLKNPKITGNSNVGALVGRTQGTISGCHVKGGAISGNGSRVGSLAGQANAGVSNCYVSKGSVQANGNSVGGLIGGFSSDMTSCYASEVTVRANGFWAGGLVGENQGTITSCYASVSTITGKRQVGGLAGLNSEYINACYATEIDVTAAESDAGGLIGASASGKNINSCYVKRGNVRGSTQNVGGFVGDSKSTINACYVFGVAVSGAVSAIGDFVGKNTGNITACYAGGGNTTLEGINSGAISHSYLQATTSEGNAKTFHELRSPTAYGTGADIYANWNIDVDNGLSKGIDDATQPGDAAADDIWDFGTNAQFPRLKVDFNGDGTATVAEFGDQSFDYTPPTITFAASTYSTTEGNTVHVTVNASEAPGANPTPGADPYAYTIPIITNSGADGTAGIVVSGGAPNPAEAADYSGLPTSVTIEGTATTAIIQIMIVSGDADTNPENLVLSFGGALSNKVGLMASGTTSTTIQISDPPIPSLRPKVQFAQAAYPAVEGSVITVEVEAGAAPSTGNSYTVPIVVTSGSTVGTDDYIFPDPAQVVIAENQTSGTMDIIILGDGDSDDGEKIVLGFGTLSDGLGEGTQTTTTITITNAEPLAAGRIPINNLEQLNAMRYDLDGNGNPSSVFAESAAYTDAFPPLAPYSHAYTGYKLMRSLDFTDSDSYAASSTNSDWLKGDGTGAGWLPIGTQEVYFSTTFDGQGHAISNLYINRPDDNYVGLFGIVAAGGDVLKLGLKAPKVTGSSNVGSLVGRSRGLVRACYVSGGTVQGGNQHIGGLVGASWLGKITGCYVEGHSVEGVRWVGGLAGSNNSIIRACYVSKVSVTEGTSHAPLAGTNTRNATIQACYAGGRNYTELVKINEGGISNSYYQSAISGGTDHTTQAKTFHQLRKATRAAGATDDAGKGYTGIFANWNVDIDDVSGADDPWHFGTANDFPKLSIEVTGNRMVDDADLAVQTVAYDPPTIAFASPTYSVTEAAGATLEIGITLSESIGAITIPYAPSGSTKGIVIGASTATTDDYTLPTHATLSGTGTSGTFVINIANDKATEGAETLVLELGSMLSDTVGVVLKTGGNLTTITISDPANIGPPSIEFVQTLYGVREGNTVTIRVQADVAPSVYGDGSTYGSIGYTIPISVVGAQTNATATTDYRTTFPKNDVKIMGASTSATFEVVTESDSDNNEVAESLTLEIGDLSSQSLVKGTNTKVTIVIYDLVPSGAIPVKYLEQLDALRYDLNGDGRADAGLSAEQQATYATAFAGLVDTYTYSEGYQLTQNLDFKDATSYIMRVANPDWLESSRGEGWEPIGTRGYRFNATFDGNNKTISNLYINRPTVNYVGLFGTIGHLAEGKAVAVVRNIGLEMPKVTGNTRTGALVGSNNRGIISNCYVNEATVRVSSYRAGGLAGQNWNWGTGTSAKIENCYVTNSTIRAGENRVGGLVGWNQQSVINNCYSSEVVASGGARVGGLVGGNNFSTVSACYVARATLTGTNSARMGTIIGSNYNSTMSACYAGAKNYTHLVGYEHPGTVTNSYYQAATSGGTSTPQAKTFAELRSPIAYGTGTDIYANWNLDLDDVSGGDDPWYFGTASDFPKLRIDVDKDGDIDNDDYTAQTIAYTAPEVEFMSATYTASKATGSVTVQLTVTGAETGDTFTVPIINTGTAGIVVNSSSTAVSGTDYNALGANIALTNGTTDLTITIPNTATATRTIILELGTTLSEAVGLVPKSGSTKTSTTITISN